MTTPEILPLDGDLGALALAADGLDRDTAAASPEAMIQAQQQTEEQAAASSLLEQNAKAIYAMTDLAMPLLGKLYPSIPDAVPDKDRQTLAGVWAPVLTKHGINLADMGGKYKEEIAAVVLSLPIVLAAADAIRTDIAERAKKKPLDVKANDKPIQAQPVERTMPTDTPQELAGI